jgi:hypothetical protein
MSDTPLPPEALIPVEEDGYYVELDGEQVWVPEDCDHEQEEGAE